MATLAHPGISCLASSLPSSWLIDTGLSTHMTGKCTIFFTFHTSFPFIVFANSSFKHSTGGGTGSLISLTLIDVNYIPHAFFNLVYVSHLTKTLRCSITFSSYTIRDLQTKR